jgi:hypothetical protein
MGLTRESRRDLMHGRVLLLKSGARRIYIINVKGLTDICIINRNVNPYLIFLYHIWLYSKQYDDCSIPMDRVAINFLLVYLFRNQAWDFLAAQDSVTIGSLFTLDFVFEGLLSSLSPSSGHEA